jgi:hypothetical protein
MMRLLPKDLRTVQITPEKRILYTLIGLILPLAGAHRILHFRKQLGRLL